MQKIRKHPILLGLAIVVAFIVISPIVLWSIVNHPRPVGTPSAEADILAKKLQDNVNIAAWEKTRTVRFTSMGARSYVWDRNADQVTVTANDTVVTFSPSKEEASTNDALIAWKVDIFWFNPIATLFDAGVKRSIIKQPDGRDALFVEYPDGDGTLWHFDDALMPVSWQIWSKLTPVGGLRAGWGDYVTLATGAIVSSKHATFMYNFEFTNIAGSF